MVNGCFDIVIVNTIHLLDSREKSFNATLYWLTVVDSFPHRIPRTHSSNSTDDGKSVTDYFHLYVHPQAFSITLDYLRLTKNTFVYRAFL